jgi:hypothetical protein
VQHGATGRETAEELMGERAERKAKAAAMPAGTPGQRLLRDTTLALIEAREVSSVYCIFPFYFSVKVFQKYFKTFKKASSKIF